MKKCPYCYTLMNDDVDKCPNCLKDMSNLSSMSDLSSKNNKFSLLNFMFGIVISIGSLIASFSVRQNRINYQKLYDDVKLAYNAETDEIVRETLAKRGETLMAEIHTCQYKEVSFYVLCAVGVIIILYTLISYLIKVINMKKKKENIE